MRVNEKLIRKKEIYMTKTYSTAVFKKVNGMFGIVSGVISKKGITISELPSCPGVRKAEFQLNVKNKKKTLVSALKQLNGTEKDLLVNTSNEDEYVTLKVSALGYLAENLIKFAGAGSIVDCVGELRVSPSDDYNFVNFYAMHIQLSGNSPKKPDVKLADKPSESPMPSAPSTVSQPAMNDDLDYMEIDPDSIPF